MNAHQVYLLILFCTKILVGTPLSAESRLGGLGSFSYQLQNISLSELAALNFDLNIIDYSSDGGDEEAFTPSDLAVLQSKDLKVVAYFSIGEAEDYRYYFKRKWITKDGGAACGVKKTKNSPKWLDQSNRNWCGNYKVRYWQRNWKRIIYGRKLGRKKSYLDRIIDNGFDGVYLDIIDGYEYWAEKKNSKYKAFAKRMAKFVIGLAKYAREKRGLESFIVIPQNGAGILNYLPADLRSEYLNAIDAIGAEDSFFFGDKDLDNDFNPQSETLEALDQFSNAGKPVLATEYITDASKIEVARTEACSRSFLLQIAPRELDSMTTFMKFSCD